MKGVTEAQPWSHAAKKEGLLSVFHVLLGWGVLGQEMRTLKPSYRLLKSRIRPPQFSCGPRATRRQQRPGLQHSSSPADCLLWLVVLGQSLAAQNSKGLSFTWLDASSGFESPSRHACHFLILLTGHIFRLLQTGLEWARPSCFPGVVC